MSAEDGRLRTREQGDQRQTVRRPPARGVAVRPGAVLGDGDQRLNLLSPPSLRYGEQTSWTRLSKPMARHTCALMDSL